MFMSEEDIIDLKHAVEDLDKEMGFRLAQIDELREDLKLLIEYSSHAKGAIIEKANQGGNALIDKEGVERCKKFVQKYGLRIG